MHFVLKKMLITLWIGVATQYFCRDHKLLLSACHLGRRRNRRFSFCCCRFVFSQPGMIFSFISLKFCFGIQISRFFFFNLLIKFHQNVIHLKPTNLKCMAWHMCTKWVQPHEITNPVRHRSTLAHPQNLPSHTLPCTGILTLLPILSNPFLLPSD